MALFDSSMFDPQGFSGGLPGWLQGALQGGLLGRAGIPAPTGPSNGMFGGNLPQSAMGGGFGGGVFSVPPMQAVAPPQAMQAMAQGQQPPQQMSQPPEPSALQRGSAFFHNLKAGGGLIPGLFDAIQGGMTGQRTDPRGMQQQQIAATRQALVAAGIPAAVADAASLNPDVLKTIAPQLYTKPELKETGTDPLTGQKSFAVYSPTKNTLTPAPIGGPQAANSQSEGLAAFNDAIKSGITGEALYDYVPAAMKNTVKGMIEGRQQPPTGAAMRSPQTMALIDMAHSIDPTFDATNWGARFASAKDFSAGKSSEMVRAANQTLHHVGALLDSMDALKNTQFPAYNAIGNAINDKVLGKGAVKAFLPNAHAVAEEMSKVFKGANLSDAEVRQWEQSLNENMSPEQQRAAVGKLVELLNGSLQALQDKRERGLGPMASQRMEPILNADSKKVMDRISAWIGGQPTQQSGPSKDAIEAEMRRRGLLK